MRKSILICKTFRAPVKGLVQRILTSAINNRWWSAFKRAIRSECIRLSEQLNIYKTRIEKTLIKELDEVIVHGSASTVLVTKAVLYRHLQAKTFIRRGREY